MEEIDKNGELVNIAKRLPQNELNLSNEWRVTIMKAPEAALILRIREPFIGENNEMLNEKSLKKNIEYVGGLAETRGPYIKVSKNERTLFFFV